MIDCHEISVVVQGAIDPMHTVKCLSSVRRHLPGAELILSTWEGSTVEGLDVDRVILNADPGPSDLIRLYPFEHVNNVNRQIVSTREGIKRSSRKYVLKIRTDMLVLGRGFLKYYEIFGAVINSRCSLTQRIMANAKNCPFPEGAVGDWWLFGLKKDMLQMWDIPLYPDKRGEEYFLRPENVRKKPYGRNSVCRFIPERWISYQFCRKFTHLELLHDFDRLPKKWDILVQFLENNFLTIDHDFSDIVLPKARNIMSCKTSKACLSYRQQIKLLQSTCTDVHIPLVRRFLWWIQYTLGEWRPRPHGLDYIYIIRNYATAKDLEKIECVPFIEEDVTFVVNGMVNECTEENLVRIKKKFPKSKLILSIDTGQDISGLSEAICDEVVRTPVQGEYYIDCYDDLDETYPFTYNKQQVEVRNGLLAVKTQYAVRLRTDCYIEESKLLSLYQDLTLLYAKRRKGARLFKQKILTCDLITGCLQRDPGYLSNSFAFGLTEDLLKLYNGRLMTLDDILFFRESKSRAKRNPKKFSLRFSYEQFFYFSLLRECHRDLDMPETYCEWGTEQAMLFERYLTNNFIVCSFREMGICSKFEHCTNRGIGHRFLEKYIVNVDPKNESLDRVLKKERKRFNIF